MSLMSPNIIIMAVPFLLLHHHHLVDGSDIGIDGGQMGGVVPVQHHHPVFLHRDSSNIFKLYEIIKRYL